MKVLVMCVSTGPRICLLCLLLYSWQGKAEDSGIGGKGQQYDDQHTKTTEDEDGLFFMEKDYFLTKLMDKYGNGVEMTYEGFEHLLYHLGLGGIVKFDHGISCHKEENGSEFLQIHLHHNHSVEATPSSKMCAHEEEHSHHDHDHDDHAHNEHNHEDGENHNEHEHHTHNETLHGDGDHDHDHSHEHDDHEHSPGDNEHSPNEHDHMHDAKGTNSDIHGHSEHEQIDHEQNGNVEENLDHEHTTNISTTDTHLHDDGDTHEHDHGQEDDHGEHDHEHHVHKRHIEHNECLPPSVLLHIVHSDDHQTKLTKENFKEICPILIYQIDADSCHSSNSHKNDHEIHGDKDGFHGDHDHDNNEDHDHAAHSDSAVIDLAKVPAKVWGFSTIAVIIISLVGLLGVAVIPIMQKVFYNHMLQFLVALAVGALSGDALLHLFPHAIAGGHGDEHGGHDHSGEEHAHDPAPIYKGLLGLFGIYFFFFTERALTMFTEYKRKKKQKRNRKKYFKDEELVKVGERLAKSECDGMMMSIHPNKALRGYADETHTEHCIISLENTTKISHEHGQRQNCHAETCVDGDENTSMIGSTNSTPVSHGHGHGHSHAADGVPTSVASVAWMVIMGDGIHNFSDGLAIGAAFVNSITGGFSTSIAVFCHELPHEIGDFAMLLRAGMSPKQAIIYNCLSSILCFFGMVIGVAIGNLEGASLWIFSLVGGMFLYIALVDMLPELSSVETKKGEHPLCHLLLQGVGMCIGAGIMLAIALYEGELKTLLE